MKWDNNQHRWSPWRLNSGWEMDINADQSVALSTLGQSPCCLSVKRWDRWGFLIGAVWCSSIWRINILHQYQTEKGNTMLFHCASLIFTELKCLRGLLLLLVGSSSPKGSASENQLIFKKIYLSSLNCKFLPLAFTLNLRTDYIFFSPFFLTSLREKKKGRERGNWISSQGVAWNMKKCRATLNATLIHSLALPCTVSSAPPLHSRNKLFHFCSAHRIFISLRGAWAPSPWRESWWMCWAHTLWSSQLWEPLYTCLLFGCLQCS